MSYISAILISIFLSSAAEARRHDYSVVLNTTGYGSLNPLLAAGIPRPRAARSPLNSYHPAVPYPTLIWPSLPGEKRPYWR